MKQIKKTLKRPRVKNKGIGYGASFYIPVDKTQIYQDFVSACEKKGLNLNQGILAAMEEFNNPKPERE